jgi:hypothetical protein
MLLVIALLHGHRHEHQQRLQWASGCQRRRGAKDRHQLGGILIIKICNFIQQQLRSADFKIPPQYQYMSFYNTPEMHSF